MTNLTSSLEGTDDAIARSPRPRSDLALKNCRRAADVPGVKLHVRAAIVRSSLDAAATLPEGPALAALWPLLVTSAAQRAPHEWLPFEAIVALDDTVAALGGLALVEELHRRAADPTLGEPIFRPLVENAFRFFGRTPSALLRWTPGALRMSLRGIPHVSYADRPSGCRLTMLAPPQAIVNSETWRAGTRGSLRGIVERTGFTATVDDACDDAAFVHEIRWARP